VKFSPLFFILVVGISSLSGSSLALAQSDPMDCRIELADGKSLDAQLVAFDSDQIKFATSSGEQSVSLESVNEVIFAGETNSEIEALEIGLIDGSKLAASTVQMLDGSMKIKMASEQTATIHSKSVDYLLFSRFVSALAPEWNSVVQQERASDALVIAKNEKTQTVDGIVGDLTPDSVQFTIGERTASIKRSKISGILFYHRAIRDFADAAASIRLTNGSELNARSLSVTNGQMEVVTVAGVQFSILPANVANISFANNRMVPLTDLDPATNVWNPLLSNSKIASSLEKFSRARIDGSYMNRPLALAIKTEDGLDQLRKETFQRGFAIKGGGKLSFLLAGQYKKLSGLIGFDPNANPSGNVRLVIQVDGKTEFDQVLEAQVMKEPLKLDLDLASAERLVFRVDYHDRRSIGDVLHAVDMKLHR
jgi:hypothetical protein